jgi:hypothetical protein
MEQSELNAILQKHKAWLDSKQDGQRAYLREADLRRAYLREADLRGAYLRRAYLREADLSGADLSEADLREADLRGADLREADLRGADLSEAYLRRADLREANLDFSCLPLWCGSKGMIVDARIAAQIAAHFCALTCDDPGYQAARAAVLEFARTSHRARDLEL